MAKELITIKVTPRTKQIIDTIAGYKQQEKNEVLEEILEREWEWMERDIKGKKLKGRRNHAQI